MFGDSKGILALPVAALAGRDITPDAWAESRNKRERNQKVWIEV
jgi:hypothetical protein